jgi:exonuclease III
MITPLMNRGQIHAKIGNINARSISTSDQFNEFHAWFIASAFTVITVTESHLCDIQINILTNKYPDLEIDSHAIAKQNGVTIILRKNLACFDTNYQFPLENDVTANRITDKQGRMLIRRVKLTGFPKPLGVNLAVVYVPTKPTEQRAWLQERVSYFQTLEQADQRTNIDIFSGDWNMTESHMDSTSNRPTNYEHVELLHQLLISGGRQSLDYLDGWRHWEPDSIEYTHRNPANKNAQSRIDRVYIREDWFRRTKDWKIEVAGTSTDHKPCSFLLVSDDEKIERGPGRWRLNPLLLLKTENLEKCYRLLEPAQDYDDPMEGWMEYKKLVQQILAPTARQDQKGLQKKRRKLYSQLKRAQKKRKVQAYDTSVEQDIYILEGELQNLEEWTARSYAYNAMAKQHILGERPNKQFFARQKKINNTMTSIKALKRSKDDSPSTDIESINQIAKEFYGPLFAPRESESEARAKLLRLVKKKVNRNDAEDLTEPVSYTEIESAIRRGSYGSSPGFDGLPYEFYKKITSYKKPEKVKGKKQEPHVMVKLLKRVFDSIQNAQSVPTEFNRGALTVLYKNKGDPELLKFYRPLTLMGVDYKLYTDILMHRLVTALEPVIGPQQTAFLKGRLIDDNIRTVQYLINDKHQEEEPLGILFLDQEKAYDRVSHSWLWAVMRRMGIPEVFIQRLKVLYQGCTINTMINGYRGEDIEVGCGVRQGDPISCPLFIIAIEPLALAVLETHKIKGVELLTQILKVGMYADDTWILIRNNAELQAVLEILDLYGRASGAKVNWDKSLILEITPIPGLELPADLTVASRGAMYKHLGVPVGVDIGAHITRIWNEMKIRLHNISRVWSGFHMSLRGRTMVASSMLMSIPRYLLRFLKTPANILKDLEIPYWALVWGDKPQGIISRKLAMLPRGRGGLGCLDITSIHHANMLAMFADMERKPDQQWVEIVRMILQKATYRTKSIVVSKLTHPWRQLGSQSRAPSIPPGTFRDIWLYWTQTISYSKPDPTKLIQPWEPETTDEILNIYPWYHRSFDYTIKEGVGQFGSEAIRTLDEFLPEGLQRIADILDPRTLKPKTIETDDPARDRKIQKGIQTIYDMIPERWKDTLSKPPVQVPARDRRDPNDCRLNSGGKPVPLSRMNFKKIYQDLIWLKTAGLNLDEAIKGPLDIAKSLVPVEKAHKITTHTMWLATRNLEAVPKAGDLIWRFLHSKVKTAAELEWVEEPKKRCPIDNQLRTKEHVWLECAAAKGVWETMEQILENIIGTKPPRATSIDHVIAYLCVSPYKDLVAKVRWKIFMTTAVWAIWKSYLVNSIDGEDFTVDGIRTLYQRMLLSRLHLDRSLAMNYRYTSKRHNRTIFKGVWGVHISKVKLVGKIPLSFRKPVWEHLDEESEDEDEVQALQEAHIPSDPASRHTLSIRTRAASWEGSPRTVDSPPITPPGGT